MKRAPSCLMLAAFLATTLGCGTSSMMPAPSTTAQVRVIQGANDVGSVDVLLNSNPVTPSQGLLQAPVYSSVPAGSVHFTMVPASSSAAPVLDKTFALTANTYNSIVAMGRQSNGSLTAISVVDDHTPPPTGQLKLRFLHGASTVGSLDVYVAKAGDAFPAAPAAANLSFKSVTDYLTVPAANVHVCGVPAGSQPPGGGIGVFGVPCSLDLVLLVSPTAKNFTFAVFDPPISSGPGFVLSTWVVLNDLH